jgi:Fic family protein
MRPFDPDPLPPAEIDFKKLLPLIGKANRAVATLEGLFYGLPNPNVLLSPITTQEAVLSSKIEGTQADLKDVLKFEAGEPILEESRRHDIQEIINYRNGLNLSEKLLKEKPFCLNSLLRLHEVLMDSVRGFDKKRGYFRDVQNWIGSAGSPLDEAVFVPPSPLNVVSLMGQWEKYWHSEAPDTMVQLALLHAQFEIIHPFMDGNGRLGRMIIPLFLFEKGLLSRPCFYLSAYFDSNRDEYIARLRELGKPGSWNRWIAFFLEGIAVQASANMTKARAIQDLYDRLNKQIIELTHSQFAVPVLDYMFQRPIFRASDLTKIEQQPTAATIGNILTKLKAAAILKTVREGSGQRPQILVLAELLNLCEGSVVI